MEHQRGRVCQSKRRMIIVALAEAEIYGLHHPAAIAGRYDSLLSEHHLTDLLTRPSVRSYGKHCFNQYVVRVADGQRDVLRKHLADDSVGTEIYYPMPLHLQKVFDYLGYKPGDFPVTERACKEVLAMPMFPELTLEQQRRVVDSCVCFLVKQRGLRRCRILPDLRRPFECPFDLCQRRHINGLAVALHKKGYLHN